MTTTLPVATSGSGPENGPEPETGSGPPGDRDDDRRRRLDSGRLLSAVFAATLAGSLGLVGWDAWQTAQRAGAGWAPPAPAERLLPRRDAAAPPADAGPAAPDDRIRPYAPGTVPALPHGEAMTFTFVEAVDGRPAAILAKGALGPGSADDLAAFWEETGGRAREIRLDSPGGLVGEGLAAGRWVRETGLDTRVDRYADCTSSCPLVLAGGVARLADPSARIGVHQMFREERRVAPVDDTMRTTQVLAADVLRHFLEMGVSAEIMEPALRTPPIAVYLFDGLELERLGLAEVAG